MRAVLEHLRLAPSASNHQPWRYIVVRDADTRRRLAAAARHQEYLAAAPVLIVACGYPDRAQDFTGGMGNSLPIDVAVSVDRMMLAAAALGLGTCWIGAYDEKEIKTILSIPESVRVVGITPLGYPSDPALLNATDTENRRRFDEVVCYESYPAEARVSLRNGVS